jgi:acyl-CoA synthetase (AMP-forming)/AMP-acid ligase II
LFDSTDRIPDVAVATLDLVTHERAEGRSPAVITAGTTLTYAELDKMVSGVERSLRHNNKALVLCSGDRDLTTLSAYLAALRIGHTVGFLPATAEILSAYQPEFVVTSPDSGTDLTGHGYTVDEDAVDGVRIFRRRAAATTGTIHPDTALLLATSGSTGSPKTVRLSYAGLADNSDAVINVLGITADDRGATTLPITHVYGLSVVNTHLRAGASILLSNRSPLSMALWQEMTKTGATSLAAVPTTYAAFGPAHVSWLARSRIRTMTQSGARLPDEVAMRLWRMLEHHGGRFFVMYGQTEATGRIACLDPAELPTHLGSVGVPLPGSTVTITPVPAHHGARPGEGAVHYSGPGVMLGYASDRADLGRGGDVDVLATGDLGYLDGGYLYLTGRTKRIAKVLGIRTSLDDLERMVEQPGQPMAVVCGTDDVVHLVGAGDPAVHEGQRRQLAESLGVPGRHVVFQAVDAIPRTPGGKVDYRRLAEIADAHGRCGSGVR